MQYEDLMHKLRTIVPKEYFEFKSADKSLVYHLVKPACTESRRIVASIKDKTFNSYSSKTNSRSISTLAKRIIDDCSPTAFSDFLNELDSENKEEGDIAAKVAISFRDTLSGINDCTANDDIAKLFYEVIKEAAEKPRTRNTKNKNSQHEDSAVTVDNGSTVQINDEALMDPLLYELVERIKKHEKLYVKTQSYRLALKTLKASRRLLIVGAPGSGKSFTSEMIVNQYMKDGYSIVVANQVDNLRAVAEAVSSTPSVKELVFIDDCLGQAYLTLNSTQENDLIRLIFTIKQMKNKAILLNSRVYIVNQEREKNQSILGRTLKDFYNSGVVLSLDSPTELEKAKIFYNHLRYMPGITNDHYKDLQKGKRYRKIIRHENYNPRLIWSVTQDFFLNSITPNQYFDSVMDALNNPDIIWDEEFNKRLSSTERMIMTSLFSITHDKCEIDLCQNVFLLRMKVDGLADSTQDYFTSGINKLSGSMISVSYSEGKNYVSVINPSVNDYIRSHIVFSGSEEQTKLRKAIIAASQIRRLYDLDEALKKYINMLKDRSLLELIYDSDSEKGLHVSALVAESGICDDCYRPYLKSFLNGKLYAGRNGYTPEGSFGILINLLEKPTVFTYYSNGISFESIICEFMQNEGLDYFVKLFSTLFSHPQSYGITTIDNNPLMTDLMEKAVDFDIVSYGWQIISDSSYDYLTAGSVYSVSCDINIETKRDLLTVIDPSQSLVAAKLPAEVLATIRECIDCTDINFSDDIESQIKEIEEQSAQKGYSSSYQVNTDSQIDALFMQSKLK